MKRFTMYRGEPPATHDENQANAPDEPQFEGVEFSDGTVAIRWLTAKRSTSVWGSVSDMLAIHGHPEYGSKLILHDHDHQLPDDGVQVLGDDQPTVALLQEILKELTSGRFVDRALRAQDVVETALSQMKVEDHE